MTAKPPATTPRRGLTPGELAQAAVMAALCAATAIIAVVVPFASGLSVLGTVPMGLLAYRYRLRVMLAATVAAATIAFLIAGMGGAMTVIDVAYIGGLTGVVKRRGRGTATAFGASIVAGAIFGLAAIAALTVLTRLRTLIFDSLTAGIEGIAKVLERIPVLDVAAEPLRTTFATMLDYWPLLMLFLGIASITSVSMIGWWALSRILARLLGVPDVHKLDTIDEDDASTIAPVPARLTDVRFRYPGVDRDALGPVSMALQPGEHVAVTGPNGSGKTTLMLMLAGRQPTSGSIERAGAVGLGRIGGTAVVMQHPESQVLGTRVADDVVWGLPVGATADVDRLLAEVGLDGLAERDTGGLSGGELQRLAVAGALAREPSLLIADEVTSMVDQQGRDTLMNVLSGLTDHHRMSLVHITHYNDEADSADRTVMLSGNGGTADNTDMVQTSAVPAASPAVHRGAPVLELTGVGHEYASGTPWAKTALRDITFTVNEGDGVLVHGLNGSGKSTLAWIMAGLTVPTYGACLLDGSPVAQQVGSVAISFQAARLQLMRSTVGKEIASAAGFSAREHDRVAGALEMVGLDAALAQRRIDQLSGGQMRRVVLAGLLARSPRALILDEPLAGLDAASQRGLLRLLEELRHNNGLTVVVISHDFTGLEGLCPRTLHLHNGELALAPTAAGGAR
ncbi:ATP-binding cassette domain-containing protein [Mycolicibacterium boenickei]